MDLRLKRTEYNTECTLGKLYINDEYFCDTLEDVYRDLKKENKVHGKTCIPFGKYKVVLNIISPKFSQKEQYKFCSGKLPRLVNVPHFEGVLVHSGNTNADTDGCVLVGKRASTQRINSSTETFKSLYAKLQDATDDI